MSGLHLKSEYGSVLSDQLTPDILKQFCVGGGLRTSSLRSVVWRILLRCLPVSKIEWCSVAHRTRANYISKKKNLMPNPHDETFSQDPQHNNPLAENENCPWNKYFADNDVRDIISKDVMRTFPEIQFFQQENVRSMMADILFVYAKENSFISYKQGMHEILAPLMFVLYSDQQAYQHALEGIELNGLSNSDKDILDTVYDPTFLEHDAYEMFSELMFEVGKWYEHKLDDQDEPCTSRTSSLRHELFTQEQSCSPGSEVMKELSEIERRLHEVDHELANHLKNLEISPQLYGIRWLRLLFGREFPIHDLLFVWDLIISDRPIGRIVECIFIAMLVQIRTLLLETDFGGCMHYLMRYPPIVDISTFVQLCRHFRSRKVPRPVILTRNNFSNITVSGTVHPNAQSSSHDGCGYPSGSAIRPKARSMLVQKMRPSPSEKQSPLVSRSVTDTSRNSEKEIQLMEHQVALLQSRLNEKEIICGDVAYQLDNIAEELIKTEPSRRLVGEKLKQLSSKLTSQFPPVAIPLSAEQVEMGREVQASVRPARIKKENEMVELRSSFIR